MPNKNVSFSQTNRCGHKLFQNTFASKFWVLTSTIMAKRKATPLFLLRERLFQAQIHLVSLTILSLVLASWWQICQYIVHIQSIKCFPTSHPYLSLQQTTLPNVPSPRVLRTSSKLQRESGTVKVWLAWLHTQTEQLRLQHHFLVIQLHNYLLHMARSTAVSEAMAVWPQRQVFFGQDLSVH